MATLNILRFELLTHLINDGQQFGTYRRRIPKAKGLIGVAEETVGWGTTATLLN